jgi:hypothetical protein
VVPATFHTSPHHLLLHYYIGVTLPLPNPYPFFPPQFYTMEQEAEMTMPELMARFATAMTTLANVSTMQLASNLSTAKSIM